MSSEASASLTLIAGANSALANPLFKDSQIRKQVALCTASGEWCYFTRLPGFMNLDKTGSTQPRLSK